MDEFTKMISKSIFQWKRMIDDQNEIEKDFQPEHFIDLRFVDKFF